MRSRSPRASAAPGSLPGLTRVIRRQVSDKVDIIAFYGNPPKKSSRRAIFSADGQPFQKVRSCACSSPFLSFARGDLTGVRSRSSVRCGQHKAFLFLRGGRPRLSSIATKCLQVMKAILSNSEPVDLPGGDKVAFDNVLVVLERKAA